MTSAASRGDPLDQAFFAQPVLTVARALVGAELEVTGTAGACRVRIVETEAYGGTDDPASHAGGGPTPRSAIMFGPAGFAYVYVIYGMHHCLNLVTGPEGEAGAVLIRAAEPMTGVPTHPGKADHRLCAGPGLLCRALGIDRSWNGFAVAGGLPGPAHLRVRPGAGDVEPQASPRIGIRRAVRRPWRFFDPASNSLSR